MALAWSLWLSLVAAVGPTATVLPALPAMAEPTVLLQGEVRTARSVGGRVELLLRAIGLDDQPPRELATPLPVLLLTGPLASRWASAWGNPADLQPGAGVALRLAATAAEPPALLPPVALAVQRGPVWQALDERTAAGPPAEADGITKLAVTVPLVFPVLGRVDLSDTFLAARDGGRRRHHGQDLMAPKMRPLLACFDGLAYPRRGREAGGSCSLVLRGDNGWEAFYVHVNNDTPGTDDGLGGAVYAFPERIADDGTRVAAGELIGWVGDSGNAEQTASHCHFELANGATRVVYNAFPSLRAATRLAQPRSLLPAVTAALPAGEQDWDGVLLPPATADGPPRLCVRATRQAKGCQPTLVPLTVPVDLPAELPCEVLGQPGLPAPRELLAAGAAVVLRGRLATGVLRPTAAWVEAVGLVATPALQAALSADRPER
ncbi:MAG: M23 family metallopeptidase [Fimbriimonadaceae bacterium]|nr:M23 family metallopeptidase [Fimbriimonadaceae bacterium]